MPLSRQARFWRQALEYEPVPPTEPDTTWWRHYRERLDDDPAFADRLFDPTGRGPAIWFQPVLETKAGKNRLHLDLYPTGRDNALTQEQRVATVDARVAELVALGATIERIERDDNPHDPEYYVVLHDPEGNELCVS